MSGIRQWLEELGLGQYADAFEENDIEPILLPNLTDEALEKLGVTSMGHRMKLLTAAKESSEFGLRAFSDQIERYPELRK